MVSDVAGIDDHSFSENARKGVSDTASSASGEDRSPRLPRTTRRTSRSSCRTAAR
jgi:hypothetical protein